MVPENAGSWRNPETVAAGRVELNEPDRRGVALQPLRGPRFEMGFDGGNIVPINDVMDELSPGILS